MVDIDRAAKRVHTDKGNSFSYDRLILATGSGAGFPPYVTAERAAACDGVFVYRGVADLERILNYGERPEITRAVVVGGGLLGLEAAKAVYDMPGCVARPRLQLIRTSVPDVSIINRQAYPLSRQLDADAGEMVLRKVRSPSRLARTDRRRSRHAAHTRRAALTRAVPRRRRDHLGERP